MRSAPGQRKPRRIKARRRDRTQPPTRLLPWAGRGIGEADVEAIRKKLTKCLASLGRARNNNERVARQPPMSLPPLFP